MNIKQLTLTLAAVTCAVTTSVADSTNKVPNWGTDILHYFVQEKFTNNAVESNATATVQLQFKEQGNAKLQKFDLVARKLTPNSSYSLLAMNKDETNYSEAMPFTTDAYGTARLKLMSHNNGKGNGNGHGNGPKPIPAELDPVYALGSIAISDVNTQVVAQADLTSPDRLQYLVKRKLVGDSAAALLRIQGTMTRTHFRLQAVNLAPSNTYWLSINETVVQTNTADAKGRLNINSLATPAGSPLDIQKVELLDTSTNVLLSTELP